MRAQRLPGWTAGTGARSPNWPGSVHAASMGHSPRRRLPHEPASIQVADFAVNFRRSILIVKRVNPQSGSCCEGPIAQAARRCVWVVGLAVALPLPPDIFIARCLSRIQILGRGLPSAERAALCGRFSGLSLPVGPRQIVSRDKPPGRTCRLHNLSSHPTRMKSSPDEGPSRISAGSGLRFRHCARPLSIRRTQTALLDF